MKPIELLFIVAALFIFMAFSQLSGCFTQPEAHGTMTTTIDLDYMDTTSEPYGG